MALHPQSSAFLAALELQHQDGPDEDVAVMRATARAAALLVTDRVQLEVVDDVDAGGVPCRLYRPSEGAPVMLYVHGGAWMFHDLETHDVFCRYLANETGWALFAVDYRRAPEHPWPAPLDDVEMALHWLKANGEALGVDTAAVPAVGDSSGANLVAGLSIRDPKSLAMQFLIYPPVDPRSDTESMRTESTAALDAAGMVESWEAYAGGADHEEIAPLRAADLSTMPPTFLITAEHDILRGQGELFAARLAAAGVPVTAYRALGMIHGFWRQPAIFDESRAAVRNVAAALRTLK